jgi:hypothetical protein
MKTAYELAMERLNKTSPVAKLTEEKKKALAELDSKYAAKIAEREITLNGEIQAAAAKGDVEQWQKFNQQLATDRQNLQAELELKKQQVRESR